MKMVAVGLGCRKNASADSVAALVRESLARLPREPARVRLYSSVRKSQERGLREAAAALGYDIAFLDDADLLAVADRVATRSAKSREATGHDSVAEAAALAGAGPKSTIVVPRVTSNDAACAIAAEISDSEDRA